MPGTTSFPSALDTFPDIDPTTQEDAAGFEHDIVHNNEAAAILALQAKVGIDASTDDASVDHRIFTLETNGITIHGRVDTYADLPNPPAVDTFNYYVNDERLVYIWDGTKWPSAGNGVSGGASPMIEFDSQVTILPGQIAMPADKITLIKVSVGTKQYMLPVWAFDPNDPYYSMVVALTFFDGAGGGTGIVDVKGSTWIVNGPGAIDSSNRPFQGVNSFKLPRGSHIQTTIPAIGDQDFTIETMIYLDSTKSRDAWWRLILLNNGFNNQGALQLSNNSTTSPPSLRGIINNNNTILWSSSTAISLDKWHHVEYNRAGNTYRFYLDGVLAASGVSSAAHNFTDTVLGFNGHFGSTGDGATQESGDGNYGMIRVTIGVARHTTNFSPPYARFQTS